MNYIELLGTTASGALTSIPVLLAWLIGIMLAARMLNRGGGKPEKLLLAGCSLMLVSQVVKPFLTGFALWMIMEQCAKTATTAALFISLPRGILDMAGIICLILAFWLRWKTKSVATQ